MLTKVGQVKKTSPNRKPQLPNHHLVWGQLAIDTCPKIQLSQCKRRPKAVNCCILIHSDFQIHTSNFITMFHFSMKHQNPHVTSCHLGTGQPQRPTFSAHLRLPSPVLGALLWAVLLHLSIHPMGITSFGKGHCERFLVALPDWFVYKTTRFHSAANRWCGQGFDRGEVIVMNPQEIIFGGREHEMFSAGPCLPFKAG